MSNDRRKRNKKRGKREDYAVPNTTSLISTTPVAQTDPVQRDISQGFSAMIHLANDVLVNSDISMRNGNERLQRQMLNDPTIQGSLNRRQLATAQLNWQVVPEDVDDKFQVKVANFIDSKIRDIPNLMDLYRDLLWATWRGTGVSELNWHQSPDNSWGVNGHRPHHGDKFLHTKFGEVRLRTRDSQMSGRELEQGELDRLIIHVSDRDDGEFFEGASADMLYRGRGLRSSCWNYFFIRHNALKLWLSYLEQKGSGWLIGRYPNGNKEAKLAMESVLRNLTNSSKVSLPVPANIQDSAQFGIENLADGDRSGTSDMFMQFVDGFCGKKIRLLIEGQETAEQTTGDGLGSGRADALQDIFVSIRNYDANSLSQTLTDTLVARLVFFNFGNVPFKLKFNFVTEDRAADIKDRIEAAKLAGLTVPAKWVYDGLGIPQPSVDEAVIHLGDTPSVNVKVNKGIQDKTDETNDKETTHDDDTR